MPTLVLGEALVDLVCETPVDGLAEAPAFTPHAGGAGANVAVFAARAGAKVALAGGAGDDAWGAFLHDRLAAEGVDLAHWGLHEGLRTAVAFVAVDAGGEPSFAIYDDGIGAAVRNLGAELGDAVAASDALFFSTGTMVGEIERAMTMDARERALEAGRPVLFDPNLRPGRWEHPGRAVTVARECVPDALLVKLNRAEARALTGEPDPERAAAALLAAGAKHVVVTLGADGALLLGEGRLRVRTPGVPARAVDATGAGDTIAGVLLARLSAAGFYGPAIAAALPDAVAEAARTTERWGAF